MTFQGAPRIVAKNLAGWASLAALVLCTTACRHSGGKFYPIGIYGVPTTNDLRIVRDAGFNVVAGRAESNFLAAAAQLGVKVLASPGTSAGPKFNPDRARETVMRFDRHPALWAWYLIDEPDLNGVDPEDVWRAHAYVKRLAARKPTALVLYQGSEALHYGNIADITMIDRYPVPWLPLANFPQHVRMARLAVPPKKPLIAVIQAFDWSYYPSLLPGEKNLRPPTYEEIRCMTYCALARRATGLFYYCFKDGSWKMPEHPEVWRDLQRIVAEVGERLPLFEASHVWWSFAHEFSDPSKGFNEALESSVIPALLDVKIGNERVGRGQYLLCVNNTDRQFKYRITPPPVSAHAVSVFGESRSVPIEDGWIEDTFLPFAVHIYGPLGEP